jgi:hypothetical protein
VEAATYTKSAQKKKTARQPLHAVTANCRDCSHAREEIRKRRSQKVEKKASGMISSSYTTPGLSFAAAPRNQPEKSQQSQTYQIAEPYKTTGTK